MSNKWVEVEAKTIDDAIKAGLKELQLDDATEADISILSCLLYTSDAADE